MPPNMKFNTNLNSASNHDLDEYYRDLIRNNPDKADAIKTGVQEFHSQGGVPGFFRPSVQALTQLGEARIRKNKADEPGYPEVVGKGLVRFGEHALAGLGDVARETIETGTENFGGPIAGMIYRGAAGGQENLDKLASPFKHWSKYWNKAASEGWARPDEKIYAGDFLDNPSFKRAVGHMTEGAASLAGSIGLGVLTKSPAAGAALFTKFLESAPTYSEARDAGKSADESLLYSNLVGGVVTALEALPVSRILGREGKGFVKGALHGMFEEGSTEVLQQIWSNFIARIGYDNTRDIFQGVVESFIGGVGGGGLAGGTISKYNDVVKASNEAVIEAAFGDKAQHLNEEQKAAWLQVFKKTNPDLNREIVRQNMNSYVDKGTGKTLMKLHNAMEKAREAGVTDEELFYAFQAIDDQLQGAFVKEAHKTVHSLLDKGVKASDIAKQYPEFADLAYQLKIERGGRSIQSGATLYDNDPVSATFEFEDEEPTYDPHEGLYSKEITPEQTEAWKKAEARRQEARNRKKEKGRHERSGAEFFKDEPAPVPSQIELDEPYDPHEGLYPREITPEQVQAHKDAETRRKEERTLRQRVEWLMDVAKDGEPGKRVFDDEGNFLRGLKSGYPDWFREIMSRHQVDKNTVLHSVKKGLRGDNMGKRQQRIYEDFVDVAREHHPDLDGPTPDQQAQMERHDKIEKAAEEAKSYSLEKLRQTVGALDGLEGFDPDVAQALRDELTYRETFEGDQTEQKPAETKVDQSGRKPEKMVKSEAVEPEGLPAKMAQIEQQPEKVDQVEAAPEGEKESSLSEKNESTEKPSIPSEPVKTTSESVAEAYQKASNNKPNTRVYFGDLIASMPEGVDRDSVVKILSDMQSKGEAVLMANDDPQDIDSRKSQGYDDTFNLPGNNAERHLIYMGGGKQAGEVETEAETAPQSTAVKPKPKDVKQTGENVAPEPVNVKSEEPQRPKEEIPQSQSELEKQPSFSDYGLTVKKTRTKNGNPAWEISGPNTRDFKDAIKETSRKIAKKSASFYRPRKTWSIYTDEDITSTLHEELRRLKGESIEPETSESQKSVSSEPAEKPEPAPETTQLPQSSQQKTTPEKTPSDHLANWVAEKLSNKEKFDWRDLFRKADEAFGGTQAEGKYTPKDAYDAMEIGVNRAIMNRNVNPAEPVVVTTKNIVTSLKALTDLIPTQTKRTEEQNEFQQFSTPPSLAYVAAWVANITKTDEVLEPSAGTGNLALWGKLAGAKKVVVNELSKRRADLLKLLDFDKVFTENAEQINNILPEDVKPTVVLMNPPFSATGGRVAGQRKTMNATLHIEQALKRLQGGGRLVAIVGRGMADDRPTFKSWWKDIKTAYSVKANIGISGKDYAKYGTTFDNQLLVIDKTAPGGETLITGKVESVEELVPLLKEIRDARVVRKGETAQKGERPADQQGGQKVSSGGKSSGPGGRDIQPPTGPVEPGSGETGTGPETVLHDKDLPGSDALGVESVEGGDVSPDEKHEAEGRPGRTGLADTGRNGQQTGRESSELSESESSALDVESVETTRRKQDISDSVYDSYKPKAQVKGAKKHPTKLVQSAAMAATELPTPTYKPNLPKPIIESGDLSDAQLEAVVYAGQAHSEILPNGKRKGFFIGDGTGVGKGREISGIIFDNWRQGRRKAVWLSEKKSLFKDAKRDLEGIGWKNGAKKVFDVGKTKLGESVKEKEGVLFGTYDTLKSGNDLIDLNNPDTFNNLKARVNQIVEWAGEDFDGVIAFDEAHNMGNAVSTRGIRGVKKAAAKALAGIMIQDRLPKARVVYVSATGATEVVNLSYASRLGLWGEGTPFSNREKFINEISGGGIAAMELLSKDLKALGVYMARSLSYDDVSYDRLEHKLTSPQRKLYNELASAWQIVLRNIDDALGITNSMHSFMAMRLRSQFWGTHQRFFNQVITSMQMPSVIQAINKDIENGHSVILQLVNTGEAAQERALSRLKEDEDLEDLDMSPTDQLMEFVKNSFPVQQYEDYLDNNGNINVRPVVDSQGNPVLNADAVRKRDELLSQLAEIKAPSGPLDLLVQEFGPEKVAEITGRKRRLVYDQDGRLVTQKWSKAKSDADAQAFMDDKKQILVFSDAGGTGRSFHSDMNALNQRKRIHYLVQPGWRADRAVQGLGRSHRSNQKHAPHYKLVTTDLKGQKRFLSSIARRLDQLGALTKGQRQTGSQGIFQARDNLESQYARDALRVYFQDLLTGRVEDMTADEFERQTGLRLRDSDGRPLQDLPEIRQFLNRILSMNIDQQNDVFDAFSERMDNIIQYHSENQTLDAGIETIRGNSIRKVSEEVVHKDDKSGAETKYVEIDVDNPAVHVSFDEAQGFAREGFYRNKKSGKVWAASGTRSRTDRDGSIVFYHTLLSPGNSRQSVTPGKLGGENWEKATIKDAERSWNEELKTLPKTVTTKRHILTGALLPVWDRIIGHPRILRLQTDEGERMLGREVESRDLNRVLENLGVGAKKIERSGAELADNILNKGYKVRLSNGWRLEKRRVSGEDRIELFGPGSGDEALLKSQGVISEIIGFNNRYFVPVGEKAGAVLDRVLRGKDILSEDSGGAYSLSPKSKSSNIKERLKAWGAGKNVSKGEKTGGQPRRYTEKAELAQKVIEDEIQETLPPGSVYETNLSDSKRVQNLRRLCRAFGKELVIIGSDQAGLIFFDASFSPDLKTIFINENPKTPHLFLVGHELLHLMRREAPDLYETVHDLAMALQNEVKWDEYKENFEKELTVKAITPAGPKDLESLTSTQLDEEIIANTVGKYLSRTDFWIRLMGENPSRIQSFLIKAKQLISKALFALGIKKDDALGHMKGDEDFYTDLKRIHSAIHEAMVFYRSRGMSGSLGRKSESQKPAFSRSPAQHRTGVGNIFKPFLSGENKINTRRFFKKTGIQLPTSDPKDLHKGVRYLQTMQDLAKNYPNMRRLLDAEIQRKSYANQQSVKDRNTTEPYFSLSKKSKERVNQALLAGDQGLKEFDDAHLKKEFNLNDNEVEAYKAIRTVLDEKLDILVRQMIGHVIDDESLITDEMVAAVKAGKNVNEMVMKLGKAGLDNKQIKKLSWISQWVSERAGYVPHKWKSKWVVRASLSDAEEGDREWLLEVPTVKGMAGPTRELRRKAANERAVQVIKEKLNLSEKEIQGMVDEGNIKLIRTRDLPIELFEGARMDVVQSIINSATEKAWSEFEDVIPDDELKYIQDLKKTLKENVEELYLAKGWGQHLIGRKGVRGYREDLENVLAEYLFGFNSFIAKGEAARLFSQVMKDIDPRKTPEQWKHGKQFVSDMLGESSEAGWFKKIAGLYFLAGDLSAATLNLTQNWTHAVALLRGIKPVDGKKRMAEKDISKAMKDVFAEFVNSKRENRQIFTKANDHLSEKDIEALREAYERGLLDPAFLGEQTGFHPNKIWMAYSQQIWSALFKMFTGAEGWNRTSTFLAAFRRSGSVDKAIELVNGSHFIYGRGNRPGVVRATGPVGNIMYTFMTYPINNLVFLKHRIEDVVESVHKGDREAMRTSMKVIGSNLAYIFAFGGLLGTPLSWALEPLALFIYNLFSGDDEDDLEVALRKHMPKTLGRGVVRGIPAALLGNDMSWRIQGTDVIGMPVGWELIEMGKRRYEQAQRRWNQGERVDALFHMTPDLLRNPYKAYLGFTEGGTRRDVPPIKYTVGETINRGLGFSPTRESEKYKAVSLTKEKRQRRLEKLEDFAERLMRARKKRDSKAITKLRNDVADYNREERKKGDSGVPIPWKTITSSTKKRQAAKDAAYGENLPGYMQGYKKTVQSSLGLQ